MLFITNMNGATPGKPAPAPAWAGAVATGLGLAIGLLSMHRGLYNDGIFFVQWLSDWPLLPGEKHILLYPHLLYLPLAKALHTFLNFFAEVRIDASLKLFSALFLGASGPFLIRFFTVFHGPAVSLLLTALVFLSPSVWYFAGATEIHTLHLCCAAFALGAAARPYARFPIFAIAAGATAVMGTHLSGFCLFPAMVLLYLRSRNAGFAESRGALLRIAGATAGLLAATGAAAVLLHYTMPERSVLKQYFVDIHPAGQGYLQTAWTELVLRSGVLIPAGVGGAAVFFMKDRLLAAGVLCTFPLYFHVIGTSHVEYQGGYNIPATVVWAAGAGLILRGLPRVPAQALLAILLSLQIYAGWIEVRQPLRRDLNRDTADAIAAMTSRGDAIFLYIPPSAVDFDLTQLPNLTRLYLAEREVMNLALLDSANGAGVPYVDAGGAHALMAASRDVIDRTMARGAHVFVASAAWNATDATPLMSRFMEELKKYYVGEIVTGSVGGVMLRVKG